MEQPDARVWNEWDRHCRGVEVSLDATGDAVIIKASLQDRPVAVLNAKITGSVAEITALHVEKQVTYRSRAGFFGKTRVLPGRGNGYGTILVRAVVAFARRSGFKEITGAVLREHRAENRYILEWFSKRGFIIEGSQASNAATSPVIATFRMVI